MDVSQFLATQAHARRYHLEIVLFTLLLWASFGLTAVGWLPAWALVVTTIWGLSRWMIATHELFHLRGVEEVGFFVRLLPLPFAPFNIAYREYRAIHFGHHKYEGNEGDPDGFHIRGGHLVALLGACFVPEIAAWRWVRGHGIDRHLGVDIAAKLLLFVAGLLIAPKVFLVFWLSLRIGYALNDYMFFHLLHYKGGRIGTYRPPFKIPAWLLKILEGLFGKAVWRATLFHDVHHTYPGVAAEHLPRVAELMDAACSPASTESP